MNQGQGIAEGTVKPNGLFDGPVSINRSDIIPDPIEESLSLPQGIGKKEHAPPLLPACLPSIPNSLQWGRRIGKTIDGKPESAFGDQRMTRNWLKGSS